MGFPRINEKVSIGGESNVEHYRKAIKFVRCLEAWHINMNQHALNRDDGSYLPQEYLHLVGK